MAVGGPPGTRSARPSRPRIEHTAVTVLPAKPQVHATAARAPVGAARVTRRQTNCNVRSQKQHIAHRYTRARSQSVHVPLVFTKKTHRSLRAQAFTKTKHQ